MKQKFNIFGTLFVLFALPFCMSSCSGDDEVNDNIAQEPAQPALIHFSAQLGSKGGGVNLAKPMDINLDEENIDGAEDIANAPRRIINTPDEGATTLAAEWATGEEVAMIYEADGTKYMDKGTVTNVIDGVAQIEGDLTGGPSDNTYVKIVYPYAAADKEEANGTKADYLKTGQDGTISKISSMFDVATGNGNLAVSGTSASLKESVHMNNQYAILRLRFTSSGSSITGISRLVISDNSTSETIATISGSSMQTIYVAMEPISTLTTICFTTVTVTTAYTGIASLSQLLAGKYYRSSLRLGVSALQLWDGGPLWATKNVGASSETDYGNFFAWGETRGYSSVPAYPMTDHYFSWENYKWMADGQTTWQYINKYTFDDGSTTASWYNNGNFVGDGKTALEAADDAATVNVGEVWCMPTHEQMQKLASETDNEWTTIDGVKGYKFISKSDNTKYIFLPAAGHRNTNSVFLQNSNGFYWSSELQTPSSYAWSISLSSSELDVNNYRSRYRGQSIRPVVAQ